MRKRLGLLTTLLLMLLGAALVNAQSGITAAEYDLGESTITDPSNDDIEIPLRLQGVLALPEGDKASPLVVILHGRHGMCDGNTANPWPCPDDETRFDLGMGYLAEALAERGYAALALNLNGAMTAYFGPGDINGRAQQVFDQQMEALTDAVENGGDAFGGDLEGRIDLSQIAFIGHSSGGGAALAIARGLPERPFGILLVAAAYNPLGPEGLYRTAQELFEAYEVASDVPVAAILPDCDDDQIQYWTQFAYEWARYDPQREAFAASVRLFKADHNQFNRNVEGDSRFGYPPCFGENARLLPREDQEQFLIRYAADFLDTARGGAPTAAFDVTQPPPAELYGLPVETNLTIAADDRRVLISPRTTLLADIQQHQLNGPIVPSGVGILYCAPGTDCYSGITTAGRFGHLRLDYGRGTMRFELPAEAGDVSEYGLLHLRVVPDYQSMNNTPGEPQAFGITLSDREGSSARVDVRDLSQLDVPPPAEFYGYRPFFLYPASVRIPLSEFAGVDLSQLTAVELNFDLSERGTLLMADLEFMKAPTRPVVTVEVSYRQRIALPPDAEITVRLLDISRMDAPADVLAEQTITADGANVPFTFELPYDPAALNPTNTYAVRAEIRQGERLLFTTDTVHPVLTRGNPDSASIVLIQVR